ncbi:MAG TPA: cytochrome b/b6 domain-containing protein [Candidatus Methylomirabilis sp.]|nr:cytochrome b/b6 domain-containing protein [Candidatus Methylomirabilis sp.]
MRRILTATFFVGLTLGLLAVANDASAAGPTSQDCLGCHADKSLTKEVAGKSVSLFADEAVLKASVHGRLECTACHAGIGDIPHPEKLAPVSCRKCHAQAAGTFTQSVHGRKGGPGLPCQDCHGTHGITPAKQLGTTPCRACHDQTIQTYIGSVHGRALANGVKEAALCFNCHGEAHQLRNQADPASPTNRARMAETCGRCHADRALVERRHIPIPQAYQLYQKSVHGRAVAAGKPAATCDDCHESHDLRRANDPKSSVYRENIPKTCGKCHAEESKAYLASIHGTAMRQGVMKSPVCTDCHGEHSIRAAQDPDSRVSVAHVSQTCGNCHEAEGISEKYGIPGGRLESYADSFHGLAVRGGSKVAANCASCHGVHDIRPSSDPKSAISTGNLPTTCGKCHPGAGENFAKGKVHVTLTAHEQPILFYVRDFYLLLILVTITGMGAHNALDFFKKLRREYRRRSGGAATLEAGEFNGQLRVAQGWFLRMALTERWQHGLLATSFMVLVYTGFALKFPDTWLFAWFVALEKGYAWRGWVHRGAAVLMVVACLWHLAYLMTRRGRSHFLAMLPRFEDVKETLQNIGHLLGLRSEPPRFDRFSYIEKAEYWALIWGSVVMVVTGGLLWFENLSLRFLAKWMLDVATMVHYYEAWLATLAIIVWHFYYVIFNPDVYPMNWTWLTGKISEETLRHEHPREYERLREHGELGPPTA